MKYLLLPDLGQINHLERLQETILIASFVNTDLSEHSDFSLKRLKKVLSYWIGQEWLFEHQSKEFLILNCEQDTAIGVTSYQNGLFRK
jgi:hypothetical protein